MVAVSVQDGKMKTLARTTISFNYFNYQQGNIGKSIGNEVQ